MRKFNTTGICYPQLHYMVLNEYEADHKTGMDVAEMTQLILDYTFGYPYLVSKLCQLIDSKKLVCNNEGFLEAVKRLLVEENTLFSELFDLMDSYPAMKKIVESLVNGQHISYNCYADGLNIASTFNIISNDNGQAIISNKIFETRFKNYFEFEKSFNFNKSKVSGVRTLKFGDKEIVEAVV